MPDPHSQSNTDSPTDWIIERIDSIDSTNSELSRRFAQSDTAPHLVLWADRQESGRGRLNRKWQSLGGKDLTFSAIFPSPVDRPDTPKLSLCAGLALVQILKNNFSLDTSLRWPNDILTQKGKLAGILSAYLEKPDAVICGIGINVNSTSTDFDLQTHYSPTTMLDETNRETPRDQLLSAFLSEFERTWFLADTNNFDELLHRFNEHNYYAGKILNIIPGEGALRDEINPENIKGRGFTGITEGLNPDGALLVKMNDGSSYPVSTNDLIIPE